MHDPFLDPLLSVVYLSTYLMILRQKFNEHVSSEEILLLWTYSSSIVDTYPLRYPFSRLLQSRLPDHSRFPDSD